MASEAIQPEAPVDFDLINFDASDNVPPSMHPHNHSESTDNEIDWDDHQELAVDQIMGQDDIKNEGPQSIDLAFHDTIVPITDKNSGATNQNISAPSDLPAVQVDDLDISPQAAQTSEEVEENEIDYDSDDDIAANDQTIADISMGLDGDESFNAEPADGVNLADSTNDRETADALGEENTNGEAENSPENHEDSQAAEPGMSGEFTSFGQEEHEQVLSSSLNGSNDTDEQPEDIHNTDDVDEDGFPSTGIVPDITVRYNGEEYPLFHGQHNIDTQMGFFHDEEVLDAPLDDVFQSFRAELEDDLEHKDELVLQIDDLGLQYSESMNPNILSSVTLRQLYSVLLKLSQNQNPNSTPTMYTFLNTRLNSTKRLNFLLQEAYGGTGLDSVSFRFPEEHSSQGSPGDADEDMEDADEDDDDEADSSELAIQDGEEIEDEEHFKNEEHNDDGDEEAEVAEDADDFEADEDDDEGVEDDGTHDTNSQETNTVGEAAEEGEGEDEDEEDDEDEIPAVDFDATSYQAAPVEHYQEVPGESLDNLAGTVNIDFSENVTGDSNLVNEVGGEFLDPEDGGVSVGAGNSLDFSMDAAQVESAGLDLSLGLDTSLDINIQPILGSENLTATQEAVNNDMDAFLDLDGTGDADLGVPELAAGGTVTASSITEHGDEITYDEDDGHNGVPLDVGETSALSVSSEVNEQGKRPRTEDDVADDSDVKRLRA